MRDEEGSEGREGIGWGRNVGVSEEGVQGGGCGGGETGNEGVLPLCPGCA